MKIEGTLTYIALGGVPLHVEYEYAPAEVQHVEIDGNSHMNIWHLLSADVKNSIVARIHEVEKENSVSLGEAAEKLVKNFSNCTIKTLACMLAAFDDNRYYLDHYERFINHRSGRSY